MKWLDLPPLWLLGHLGVLWVWAPIDPLRITGLARWPGIGLIGVGLLLMILAVTAMTRARTTVIPHREPDALVTSGVFRFSRNPIYLGDVLILAGGALMLGTLTGLVLVPLFVAILRQRFIRPEEARLHRHFGAAFDGWADRTRRWL